MLTPKQRAEHVIDNLMQQNADDIEIYINELLNTIKEIKELAESFPCGYLEADEFDEKDESPEDAILHTISVIRNKCVKALE